MIKVIFFGTSEFALPALKKLIEARDSIEISAVVTRKDAPAGRHLLLKESPVKELAKRNRLLIFEPETLKSQIILREIEAVEPYLGIVASYGKIIPEEVLNIPKMGFINIHPSLLPRYRGPSPLETAIVSGDAMTGVTIMMVDKEMDHGPIIDQEELAIVPDDDVRTLEEKCSILGAEMVMRVIPKFIQGKIKMTAQDHTRATYTKLIAKEDGRIDWKQSNEEIERRVRAYVKWPGSYTSYAREGETKQKLLKVIKARIAQPEGTVSAEGTEHARSAEKKIGTPGEVFEENGKLLVRCGKGYLSLDTVKPEGKREMSGHEFIQGNTVTYFVTTS